MYDNDISETGYFGGGESLSSGSDVATGLTSEMEMVLPMVREFKILNFHNFYL